MAKELPFFKFEPNQWDNGNIQMCSRELKGLFIDLCSMYWSRLGDLPFKLAMQKLCGGNAVALNSLCEDKIIAVEDGFIRIDFLEEQLSEFENTSKKNAKNAKEGWDKRRRNKALSQTDAVASNSQCEIDGRREEKRREEEIREENIKKEKSSQASPSTPPIQFNFLKSLLEIGIDKKIAQDWLKVRKTKRATNTETAFKNLEIEMKKSGRDFNDIITHCVTMSWSGFKSTWKWENEILPSNQKNEAYKDSEIWPQK